MSATINGPDLLTSDQPANGELNDLYVVYPVQDLKTMRFPTLDPNYREEQEQQDYA